ncbi:MAG TPA: hypothetical protein VF228_04195 [Iamia sp.]
MDVGDAVLAHRRALGAVLLAVAVALAGCGRDEAPPEDVSGEPSADPGPAVEWSTEEIEVGLNPDSEILAGADGDTMVLVSTDEDGAVTGHVAHGDGAFESGPPTETGAVFLTLGGLARTGDGWVAMGSGGIEGTPPLEHIAFDVFVLTSPDGLEWTVQETTGLDQPADVSEVVATDDGLVAVGALRTGSEPAMGGFRPVAWHSSDGTEWTQVDLPAPEGDGSVHDVVATDDGLVATGGDGLLWAGAADGTWEAITPEGLPAAVTMSELAVVGDDVLASGHDSTAEDPHSAATTFARSADGGRTWTPVAEPPAGEQGEGWAPPLRVGAGRVFTLLTSYIDPGANPELCYADIELCRGGSENVLYASDDDGESWGRVDLADLGDEDTRVDSVLASDDRIVLLSTGEDTIWLWSAPASSTLPVEDEPVLPEADVRFLEEGEEPEVGVEYAVPLYTHCGIDWLYLGGEPWERTDDGPENTGSNGDVYGFATLVDEDTVEYSLADGKVIATYGPPTREPEMCM